MCPGPLLPPLTAGILKEIRVKKGGRVNCTAYLTQESEIGKSDSTSERERENKSIGERDQLLFIVARTRV